MYIYRWWRCGWTICKPFHYILYYLFTSHSISFYCWFPPTIANASVHHIIILCALINQLTISYYFGLFHKNSWWFFVALNNNSNVLRELYQSVDKFWWTLQLPLKSEKRLIENLDKGMASSQYIISPSLSFFLPLKNP